MGISALDKFSGIKIKLTLHYPINKDIINKLCNTLARVVSIEPRVSLVRVFNASIREKLQLEKNDYVLEFIFETSDVDVINNGHIIKSIIYYIRLLYTSMIYIEGVLNNTQLYDSVY